MAKLIFKNVFGDKLVCGIGKYDMSAKEYRSRSNVLSIELGIPEIPHLRAYQLWAQSLVKAKENEMSICEGLSKFSNFVEWLYKEYRACDFDIKQVQLLNMAYISGDSMMTLDDLFLLPKKLAPYILVRRSMESPRPLWVYCQTEATGYRWAVKKYNRGNPVISQGVNSSALDCHIEACEAKRADLTLMVRDLSGNAKRNVLRMIKDIDKAIATRTVLTYRKVTSIKH